MEGNNQINKRPLIKKVLSVVIAVILVIGSFFFGLYFDKIFKSGDQTASKDIVDILYKYGLYYDKGSLELKNLTAKDVAKALRDNLLDEYATYYTKEEYEVEMQNYNGNYDGVGISFLSSQTIFKVNYNSPADKAGLQKGDTLTCGEIGGVKEQITSLIEATSFLNKIEDGKEFTLYYNRDGVEYSAKMVKAKYTATYILYKDCQNTVKYLSDGEGSVKRTVIPETNESLPLDTAYIRLTLFEGNVSGELKDALTYMKSQGKTKLVLDLRDNGGGYMNVLKDVCSCLIDTSGIDGKPIVAYSIDKNKVATPFYFNKVNYNWGITDISVMANERSASATECLIGAMAYYKKGFNEDRLIIENESYENKAKTFGKGIMQTTFEVSGGGAFKLTTAFIYQPDKTTCIHKKGIFAKEENSFLYGGDSLTRAIEVLR